MTLDTITKESYSLFKDVVKNGSIILTERQTIRNISHEKKDGLIKLSESGAEPRPLTFTA